MNEGRPGGRSRCIPDAGPSRRVHVSSTHVATLRARSKRMAWAEQDARFDSRHRWLVEGAHGLAKTLHGMSRATRRGLEMSVTQSNRLPPRSALMPRPAISSTASRSTFRFAGSAISAVNRARVGCDANPPPSEIGVRPAEELVASRNVGS